MTPGYELFDHTADLGVRVWAPTLAELVPPATDGLYATIGEVVAANASSPATSAQHTDTEGRLPTGDARPHRRFELAGSDAALLLRDYLAELLFLFETQHQCAANVQAREFTPEHLIVSAELRPVDDARSALLREVKAVTYHELAVRSIAGGYEATFIVDI